VDDILNIFKDYCDPSEIPPDSTPVSFLLHPHTKQIALLIESPTLPTTGTEMRVDFDLKRTYSVT
jgi:hypothetical protein